MAEAAFQETGLPAKKSNMSEYQYYEFAAIDGPISDEGLKYARGCSSRANVSRVRWQNTYTFGDFHGSVDKRRNPASMPSGLRPCFPATAPTIATRCSRSLDEQQRLTNATRS
jgi:hypothetical protein